MKSLVILAGGRSSRMGRDKVLLELNGMTFVERIFKNALVCFGHIIISTDSREHADAIRSLPAFGCPDYENLVEFAIDRYPGVGPMGGIRSVFEETDADRFSIISVDVPFADMAVLEALYDRCSKKAAFLRIGEGRPEPLIAAYDRSSYKDICRAVDRGLLKMRMALPADDTDIISSETLAREIPALTNLDFGAAFANYNTPEEYSVISDTERRT